MSRIYRSLPPKGTRLGIAYSGGLDTRCAVAWLSRQGIDVYTYTADLAQPDERDPAEIPPIALSHGAKAARLVDLSRFLGARRLRCHSMRRIPSRDGRSQILQYYPAWSCGNDDAIIRAMREDDVHVFGDGSTHKGNDIQRFYRYGILTNPELKIYKLGSTARLWMLWRPTE